MIRSLSCSFSAPSVFSVSSVVKSRNSYIFNGIAIHGSASIMTYPASHGCIRIPMFAAKELSEMAPGTVYYLMLIVFAIMPLLVARR